MSFLLLVAAGLFLQTLRQLQALPLGYARDNMSAFVQLQEREFAAAEKGFTAVKHQREVGTGYFDAVTTTVQGANASTTALSHSTEDEQFFDKQDKRKNAA